MARPRAEYGCATGTCCCQLVMPTIIWCTGSPWDSTSQRSPVIKVFTEAAKAAKPPSAASVAPVVRSTTSVAPRGAAGGVGDVVAEGLDDGSLPSCAPQERGSKPEGSGLEERAAVQRARDVRMVVRVLRTGVHETVVRSRMVLSISRSVPQMSCAEASQVISS